jgi:hypothetical protein
MNVFAKRFMSRLLLFILRQKNLFASITFMQFSARCNGWRYLRVGGRGFCLGAGKARSQKNA